MDARRGRHDVGMGKRRKHGRILPFGGLVLFNRGQPRAVLGEYIAFHNAFGTKFDRVLIDGRARVHCGKAVFDNLTDDAIVFLHGPLFELYERIEITGSLSVMKKRVLDNALH